MDESGFEISLFQSVQEIRHLISRDRTSRFKIQFICLLVNILIIASDSMYGEVTSRNHQAYIWGHLVLRPRKEDWTQRPSRRSRLNSWSGNCKRYWVSNRLHRTWKTDRSPPSVDSSRCRCAGGKLFGSDATLRAYEPIPCPSLIDDRHHFGMFPKGVFLGESVRVVDN